MDAFLFLTFKFFGHVCSDFSFWGKLAQHILTTSIHMKQQVKFKEIRYIPPHSFITDDITHQHINRNVQCL